MTKRTRELADRYAHGELPEQHGEAPATKWCRNCRTATGSQSNARGTVATHKCKKCGGRGILTRGPL